MKIILRCLPETSDFYVRFINCDYKTYKPVRFEYANEYLLFWVSNVGLIYNKDKIKRTPFGCKRSQ